ncbi:MAG: 4Fe-4S binding protein, partial [Lentisphaeraceae bacterium]|nr:4Fe-4S binding protein [Lentisphaeraceae bacterium]
MSDWKKHYLKVYRMGIVLLTVFTIYYVHYQKSVRGKSPVTLQEVKVHLKNAAKLSFTENGILIFDKDGANIGTAYSTSPYSDKIKGYAGPTESLIVLSPQKKILAVSLRSSGDTPGHVEDVKNDFEFIERWQGKGFLEIAEIEDLEEHEIWSVSGATRTSECMAWGIIERSRAFQNKSKPLSMKFQWKDAVVALVLILALIATFTKLKENVKWRTIIRWAIFFLMVLFGIDLLCLAIMGGWTKNGIPIHNMAVLAGFILLMFAIPWTTRKQIYCQQICPHGLIQETMAQKIPSKYSWKLSKELKWALKFIPSIMLFFSLLVLLFELPFELSDLEVFSAWYPTRASTVCLVLFVTSLLISAFIPKGYCKYACPTGRFLEYVRDAGKADKFGFADKVAGLILVILIILAFTANKIEAWLV